MAQIRDVQIARKNDYEFSLSFSTGEGNVVLSVFDFPWSYFAKTYSGSTVTPEEIDGFKKMGVTMVEILQKKIQY